jgi:hypothetical protein
MKYRIHFADGTHVEREAADGTTAKLAAKHARKQDTGAREANDARVKVDRVEEIQPEQVTGEPIEAEVLGGRRALRNGSGQPAIDANADKARISELEAEIDRLKGER